MSTTITAHKQMTTFNGYFSSTPSIKSDIAAY